jgi:hypothetical protein
VCSSDLQLSELIQAARSLGLPTAIGAFQAQASRAGRTSEPVDCAQAALARFTQWVSTRAMSEPATAAYMLSGLYGAAVDPLRGALASRAPHVILSGMRGLVDGMSWRIRKQLSRIHPAEVVQSLSGIPNTDPRAEQLRVDRLLAVPRAVLTSLTRQDDALTWQIRLRWFDQQPDAVMSSLCALDSERAWELRRRWFKLYASHWHEYYERTRIAATSITGLDDERAWHRRDQLSKTAPVAYVESVSGLTSEASWQVREKYLTYAPKTVMHSLRGLDDERAWRMRRAVVADCKEAIDSISGLDSPEAWELRTTYADTWPSTVIKTLGPLAHSPRGQQLLHRQLAAYPQHLSLLKHASAIALGIDMQGREQAAPLVGTSEPV